MTNEILQDIFIDNFRKTVEFLRKPAKAYEKENKKEVFESFKYMAVLLLIISAFTAVLRLNVVAFVETYITIIVINIFLSLWLHIFAYFFGAKKGLNQTFKTVFYGGTPIYLFGWIPVVFMGFWLWSWYIEWTGLQKLHGMKQDKAAYAIIIAYVIPLAALAAMILVFLPIMASMFMGISGPGTFGLG